MNIHKEFSLDILGCEPTEAVQRAFVSPGIFLSMLAEDLLNFIKDHTSGLINSE
jgi:hypothetical protein